MITLSKLVRCPVGTTETYLLEEGETESYLLKKLSTYARRSGAEVEHRVALVIFLADDTIRRMVVCKVTKAGKKLKRVAGK